MPGQSRLKGLGGEKKGVEISVSFAEVFDRPLVSELIFPYSEEHMNE